MFLPSFLDPCKLFTQDFSKKKETKHLAYDAQLVEMIHEFGKDTKKNNWHYKNMVNGCFY